MKQTDGAKKQLELLLQRYPILAGQRDEIDGAYQIIAASYEAGGKLLIAGNGGSAADAEHIVGELMKGFEKTRRLDEALAERLLRESPELGPDLVQHLQKALPAIAMDGHPALTTAYANDCAPLLCFAQQVKRSCLPDGPKVGSVTLSPRGDWRMPSDACAALWLAELEQLQIKD